MWILLIFVSLYFRYEFQMPSKDEPYGPSTAFVLTQLRRKHIPAVYERLAPYQTETYLETIYTTYFKPLRSGEFHRFLCFIVFTITQQVTEVTPKTNLVISETSVIFGDEFVTTVHYKFWDNMPMIMSCAF